MKKITCISIILLTFSFVFANEKNSDNKKLLNTSLTSYSQKVLTNTNVVLTLSYDVSTFCANSKGIATPKVSEAGGVFILTRKSPGTGSLAFNNTSGEIDYSISNPGVYTMTYKKGDASVSTTITVNKCN